MPLHTARDRVLPLAHQRAAAGPHRHVRQHGRGALRGDDRPTHGGDFSAGEAARQRGPQNTAATLYRQRHIQQRLADRPHDGAALRPEQGVLDAARNRLPGHGPLRPRHDKGTQGGAYHRRPCGRDGHWQGTPRGSVAIPRAG